MAATNPIAQYQRNAVLNARPDRLLLMLLDGAVRFAKQADQTLAARDFPAAHNALVRAQEIVVYLRRTLNPDYEISKNLDALYDFVLDRLVQANLRKDPAILAEGTRFLTELRDTWKAALAPAGAPAPAEAPGDGR